MLRVAYTFRDNNGNQAETRVRLTDGQTIGEAASFCLALAAAMAAVSDAVLVSFVISEHFSPGEGGTPGPLSDVGREALLFYSNANATASFRLPSPAGLLAETSGPYEGVAITRERLQVLGLLNAVEGLLAGALDPVGRPYGNTYIVGGYSRL